MMPVDVTWEKYFTAMEVSQCRTGGKGKIKVLTGKIPGIATAVVAELLRERVADEFSELGVGELRLGG